MKLTEEQIAIINSQGDIKINAVAGSGKTSTLIAYAKARQDCKILYLVFNKSAKMEALKKFRNLKLDHVKIETAHSLAYRHIVSKSSYTIKNQGYKLSEIIQLLNIKSNNNKRVLEFVMASHINRFLTYYCNSDKENIIDLNYLDIVEGNDAITFVSQYYDYILHQTCLFIDKMNKAEIELTHDFYLKKFQLSQPNLKYDYILFDEGQDASPAMLLIFLKQKATKVIVGDVHQQIYSWRHAINALESIHFQTFQLNTSFRFNQTIADLASEVLKFKDNTNISIIGKGGNIFGYSKAIIARTNSGLLQHAFDYMTQNTTTRFVHFEGNFNSYAFTEDGASLYDILNLYKGQKHLIKDPIIKSMKDMNSLFDFVNKTNDTQLKMLTSIVNKHNTNIPFIINMIKSKHVENHERYKADIIFSTTHRCKGLEYDTVYLADDFIKLNELNSNETPNAQIIEEINLLYVAITRAKNKVFLPESISEYCTS